MTNELAARTAAQAWLRLVDTGRYAESWTDAALLFRGAVTQSTWEHSLNGTRSPLGAMKSRTLKSVRYTKSLPGAPDGEYVVLQFNASFDRKENAVETVTPTKEPDATWRVSGYFIR